MERCIPLIGGGVTTIDDRDCEVIRQYKWRAVRDHQTMYARAEIWVKGKRTTLSMHRVVAMEMACAGLQLKAGDDGWVRDMVELLQAYTSFRCPICKGSGVLDDAVQAWDCGGDAPDCYCVTAKSLLAKLEDEHGTT